MEKENSKKLLLCGIVGVIGHIIGVIADNVTAYSTDGVDRFVGLPYQITTFYE